MKILMVCYEFPPIGGGGGRVIYEVAKRLRENNEIHVLTSYDRKSGTMPEELYGIKLFTVPSYRKSLHQTGVLGMLSYILFSFFKFHKIIQNNQYDIVHYYFSVPSGLVSLIQPKKTPYIVSLNGGDVPNYVPKEMYYFQKIIKPINQYIVKNAKIVTAVSRDLGKQAQIKLHLKEYMVISNGIDIHNYNLTTRDYNRSKIKLICVARLTYWKRIDLLIAAMKSLPELELDIFGEGEYKDVLQNLINENNLSDRVRLRGYLENSALIEELKKSDIFVLPSISDSFGIVFLEAMMNGLPVIAANAGGVPEFVKDGENGILVRPNDLDSLIEAIRVLSSSAELRKKYGLNGQEKARNDFNWDNIARQYFDAYEQIINNKV